MNASIVVVTYNSSSTIIETLDSIYNQTYNNIELVVTDDYSSDNTNEVVANWIKEHAKRFVNVKHIRNEKNIGVTGNCNIGIKAAQGDYIQLIAGDDLLVSKAIEVKMKYADIYRFEYAACKTAPFGEDETVVSKVKKGCEEGYELLKSDTEKQRRAILKNNIMAGPSGGFFSKKFIEEFGGFDENYPMIEDYPFIYHYLMSGRSIFFIDEELTRYRVANHSLCISSKSPMWISLKKFYKKEIRWMAIKQFRLDVIIYFNLRFIHNDLQALMRRK